MRPIGYSTGALAYSDFRKALQILAQTTATAVELSALRQNELGPLVEAVGRLSLHQFHHVSFHLPSYIDSGFELQLLDFVDRLPQEWLLVTHPNIITSWERWDRLGERVCIENMDKRKPIGQTAGQLRAIFERLPNATFCFDLGHAHQIDPTMGEAVLILDECGDRLRQLHVSEVNSESKHDPISLDSALSFSIVSHLILKHIPLILESRLSPPSEPPSAQQVEHEMEAARKILSAPVPIELAGD